MKVGGEPGGGGFVAFGFGNGSFGGLGAAAVDVGDCALPRCLAWPGVGF